MKLNLEPKKYSDWWKWLVGIIAVILIIWFFMEATETDDFNEIDNRSMPATEGSPTVISL